MVVVVQETKMARRVITENLYSYHCICIFIFAFL